MKLPEEIKNIINALSKAGFEACAVGGCVRDFILGHKADDWDITTNATPDQIQKIFGENARYENKFRVSKKLKLPPTALKKNTRTSATPMSLNFPAGLKTTWRGATLPSTRSPGTEKNSLILSGDKKTSKIKSSARWAIPRKDLMKTRSVLCGQCASRRS